MNKFYLPLMSDNIDKEDIQSLIDFLSQDQIPKLTNGPISSHTYYIINNNFYFTV